MPGTMPDHEDRLTLSKVRQRARRFWIATAVTQVVALAVLGYVFYRTGQVGYIVAALAVLPLGAVGFGLMTMYHFRVIQAQKRR